MNLFHSACFWRETQRPARLLIFDARLVIFIGIFILHIRLWTLVMLVVAIALFWFLERKGLSMPNAIRRFRTLIVGPYRAARGFRSNRRLVDYEFEADAYVRKFEHMKAMPKPEKRTPAKKKGVLSGLGLKGT